MLSQDRRVCEPGSAPHTRMRSYGTIFNSVTIVVFGVGSRSESDIAPNVYAVCPGGSNKVGAFFNAIREARTLSQRRMPGIVSAQDPFFIGIAGLYLARTLRVSLQVQLHTDCFSREFITASPRRVLESLIAFFILRSSSCVRVVSERILRSVKRVTKKPVSVLPILVQKPAIHSDVVPKEFRGAFSVLSVARLSKEKELHLLVRALPHLEGVDLILVGDGPERPRLESLAKSLGVADRVRFAGWSTDVAPYYKYANAFASVSRYEGYGMSVGEAALWGLPIITTDTGMVGEILKPNEEALLISRSVRGVTEAIRRLKSDGNFARSIGGRARLSVERLLGDEARYLARYRDTMHTCAHT